MDTRTRKDTKGFLLNDISAVIDRKFHMSTINGRAPRQADGNLRVIATCECGTVFVTRLDFLLKGKTKSCGCLKKRRFCEYIARRAGNLPAATKKACFHALKAAGNMPAIASRKLHLRAAIVVAASRMHGAKLLADVARRIRRTFTPAEHRFLGWHSRHPRGLGFVEGLLAVSFADAVECVPNLQNWFALAPDVARSPVA